MEEAVLGEAYALLGAISKFLKLEDNYFVVGVEVNSYGMLSYRAYLSYGDKLNTCLLWQYSAGEELLRALYHFLETADVNYVQLEYHKKQIESNKKTQEHHEKRIKELS